MPEQLTAQEAAWLDELMPRVLDFQRYWQGWPVDERQAALGEMCEVAEALHQSLKGRGLEPQHSKSMTDNRAADAQHPFYFNLHALENLIGIVGRMKRPGSQAGTMIRRLYVDNFRCLVNFELKLDELTLLLGPNGVGKTSVLDVLFGLRMLLSGAAKITDKIAFPTPTLTRWQQRDKQVFEVRCPSEISSKRSSYFSPNCSNITISARVSRPTFSNRMPGRQPDELASRARSRHRGSAEQFVRDQYAKELRLLGRAGCQ